MKLSDLKCRNAEATGVPYKFADGQGLYLFVTAAGARHWRMDYRFNGKRLTMSFGPYPEVTLLEAREKREDARRLLRDGKDPMAERKSDVLRTHITQRLDIIHNRVIRV